jgi:predicted transcriptional regulator
MPGFQDEKVTSDKIRKVIEKVKEKGVEGYEQFKHLLKLARQEHLVKYLTNQESVIQKELQDETAKQERIKKQIGKLIENIFIYMPVYPNQLSLN